MGANIFSGRSVYSWDLLVRLYLHVQKHISICIISFLQYLFVKNCKLIWFSCISMAQFFDLWRQSSFSRYQSRKRLEPEICKFIMRLKFSGSINYSLNPIHIWFDSYGKQRQKAWKAIVYICGLGARFECKRAREHSNRRD